MDRRKFVKTTLAASVAASLPILTACGEKAPVATEADTGIRAVSLDGAEIFLQAGISSPGANPLGVLATNALYVRVGR